MTPTPSSTDLKRLLDLVARLRAPDGCPWDREQELVDLRAYLLEEAHETAAAIDGGDWLDCELAGVPSDDTWRQWRYQWADAEPGDHEVRARAYDGSGEVQPSTPKAVAPDGAQGYHTVKFSVDE